MSKAKKVKNKTTAFDIVYRVVTIIMAVLMYPLLYFLNILYIQMDHKAISDLIGSLTQNDKPTLNVTYEQISLSNISEVLNTFKGYVGDGSFDFMSMPGHNFLIASLVFLGITLVLGLVIIGFAAFSNKVKVITGLSAAGFLSAVVSFFCFSEGFAAPIVSGEVSLGQLLGMGNISDFVLSLVGEISAITLDSAFYSVLFLMLGILIWSVAVLVVNLSEEKEAKQKAARKKS